VPSATRLTSDAGIGAQDKQVAISSTRFWVKLPGDLNDTQSRVLVVDDDPMARAALVDLFNVVGMSIHAVPDARSFFFELNRYTPDLCVIDTILPDATGLQIVEQLRTRPQLRRTALIGITGRRDPKILMSAFAAGVDDFLFKPVMGEELVLRARLAMQRRKEGSLLPLASGSQRRDLTTLFCDVRGFTAFAATLDPEWVVEILNGIFERLVANVLAHGGQVDKFLGDGLLAFFGLVDRPLKKEIEAINAALEMIESADAYSRESLVLGGRKLGVGIGIATGEVVLAAVGSTMQRQVTGIGDSVNLASRIQGMAGEGEVLICPRTYERTQDSVVTSGGRAVELKGVMGRPVLYPVIRVRPG
jgi:adenylate cyclase